MKARRYWPQDTIAWRFATTIVVSFLASFGLIVLFENFGGTWALPPITTNARVGSVLTLTQAVEAVPVDLRVKLSEAVATPPFRQDWYPADSPVARWLGNNRDKGRSPPLGKELVDLGLRLDRVVIAFSPKDPIRSSPDFPLRDAAATGSEVYYLAVALKDGSWLVFTAFGRSWGLGPVGRFLVLMAILLLSFGAVTAVATRQLARPIHRLAHAVRQAGINREAPAIPAMGPWELREVIAAFNAMRGQLQEFVDYRTAMLAAISHDLRTPLTRMRLRGELIADETQQARLFRDVDDMQQMIDGALAFFRGDTDGERSRSFDLSGILTSIVDDYADQGVGVAFHGPASMVCDGKPLALKRVFTNLVDNAVKYATPPAITLSVVADTIRVTITDNGPGLPADALAAVFRPFYRMDGSRNRETGGVGLGLTSAQSVVRGHGGDIVLTNRAGGGLDVVVTLPRPG